MAEQAAESIRSIVEKAIEKYRREESRREANRDYAVRRNTKTWDERIRERALWQQRSADDL